MYYRIYINYLFYIRIIKVLSEIDKGLQIRYNYYKYLIIKFKDLY